MEPNSVRKTKTRKGNTKKVSMHLLQRRVVNDNYCTRTEEHGCVLKHQEPPTPGENVVTPRTLFWPIPRGPGGISPDAAAKASVILHFGHLFKEGG